MDTRKINLYDIDEQMRSILDAAEIDEETGEFQCDLDALAALEMAEDAKIESLALYIRELKATSPGIKKEADRLYAKSKHLDNLADGYSRYLSGYFNKYCERRGVPKFKTDLITVSYHHSNETQILDEAKAYESANSIGAVTVETKYNFDKNALKKYILAHKDEGLAGVAVVEKQSLQIK